MAQRYAVTRLWVKYKGRIYRAGDLLPETFTSRDKYQNIYPRRIGVVEVPDVPDVPPALKSPPLPVDLPSTTPIINTGNIQEVAEATTKTEPASTSEPKVDLDSMDDLLKVLSSQGPALSGKQSESVD